MGMYNYVKFTAPCWRCQAELTKWQTKDGCLGFEEVDPAIVNNFYAWCDCGAWNEFTRECVLDQFSRDEARQAANSRDGNPVVKAALDFVGHPATMPSVIEQIYIQLHSASNNELALEHSWMRLGTLLAQCESGEHWRDAGFKSLDEFMVFLRNKYKRGKTQLWSYLTVAKKLGPMIEASVLEEIGISKALELKRGLKKSEGKPLPQEIIDAARKPETTIKEVRALVAKEYSLAPDEKGSWYDFDGCFMTAEERKEFNAAVKMTKVLLKIGNDVPEHIQRKEVIFAWLKEFVGTHAAELNGLPAQNTPARLINGPE